MERLECYINTILEDWDDNIPQKKVLVVISLGFDGAKVPQHLHVDYSHKATVGGVYPNHFIDINRKSNEEVEDLLDPDSSVVRAKDHQQLKPCCRNVISLEYCQE